MSYVFNVTNSVDVCEILTHPFETATIFLSTSHKYMPIIDFNFFFDPRGLMIVNYSKIKKGLQNYSLVGFWS